MMGRGHYPGQDAAAPISTQCSTHTQDCSCLETWWALCHLVRRGVLLLLPPPHFSAAGWTQPTRNHQALRVCLDSFFHAKRATKVHSAAASLWPSQTARVVPDDPEPTVLSRSAYDFVRPDSSEEEATKTTPPPSQVPTVVYQQPRPSLKHASNCPCATTNLWRWMVALRSYTSFCHQWCDASS